MSWTTVKAEEFKFQESGDYLQGRILDRHPTKYGNAYNLEDANGEKFYFFGSSQLDRELDGCVGKVVSITYRGTRRTNSGHEMKYFEIKLWNGNDGELPEEFEGAETT